MSLLPTGPPVLLHSAGSPLNGGRVSNSESGNTSTGVTHVNVYKMCSPVGSLSLGLLGWGGDVLGG